MRDPKRIPVILDLLKAYWEARPDLRLGQILGNIFTGEPSATKFTQIYNMEDMVVDNYLRDQLKPKMTGKLEAEEKLELANSIINKLRK